MSRLLLLPLSDILMSPTPITPFRFPSVSYSHPLAFRFKVTLTPSDILMYPTLTPSDILMSPTLTPFRYPNVSYSSLPPFRHPNVPYSYPFRYPNVSFLTPFRYPNVSSS